MKPLFSLLLSLLWVGAAAQTQNTPQPPPYLRFPTLPPLQLLLGDSTSRYTKENLPRKMPVLLMVFSPECSHCQHTAEELVANKEKWKDLYLVMATLHPLWQMNEFAAKYGLNGLPNLVVGKDVHYILPSFYNIRSLPYLAFYDKKGNLISTFEGSLSLEKMVSVFK